MNNSVISFICIFFRAVIGFSDGIPIVPSLLEDAILSPKQCGVFKNFHSFDCSWHHKCDYIDKFETEADGTILNEPGKYLFFVHVDKRDDFCFLYRDKSPINRESSPDILLIPIEYDGTFFHCSFGYTYGMAAGTLTIYNNNWIEIQNDSGHFTPSYKSLLSVLLPLYLMDFSGLVTIKSHNLSSVMEFLINDESIEETCI